MIDKAKCFTETMRQLALEYNAKPEDFTANRDCHNAGEARWRAALFRMSCHSSKWHPTGSGVVITANEVLHPFLKEFTGDTERFSTRIGCSSFRICCASNAS